MLRNELRPAFRTEERGNLSELFHVLHDNSRAHTRETILELIFQTLNQPTHSQNNATSDFHLFKPLKCPIGSRRFADAEEAKGSVCTIGQSTGRWDAGRKVTRLKPSKLNSIMGEETGAETS